MSLINGTQVSTALAIKCLINAELILRCNINDKKSFEFLSIIYKKQKLWAAGSDINKINDSIKKIGLKFNLDDAKMDECLKNDQVQDDILNQRIEAQKKYKIESTPTVMINGKKYSGKIQLPYLDI